jgi:hypothetical protein
MTFIVITCLIVLISFSAPLWLRITLLGANTYIPDAIPFLDEALQGASVISKLKNGFNAMMFIKRNPGLSLGLTGIVGYLLFSLLSG